MCANPSKVRWRCRRSHMLTLACSAQRASFAGLLVILGIGASSAFIPALLSRPSLRARCVCACMCVCVCVCAIEQEREKEISEYVFLCVFECGVKFWSHSALLRRSVNMCSYACLSVGWSSDPILPCCIQFLLNRVHLHSKAEWDQNCSDPILPCCACAHD